MYKLEIDTNKLRKYIPILFLLIILYIIYKIYHYITPFIISSVLIYLFAPIVNYISNIKIKGKNISRAFSVIILYTFIIVILTLSSMILFPMLYAEGQKIATELPKQINNFKDNTLPVFLESFQKQIDKYGVDVNLKDYLDKSLASYIEESKKSVEALPNFIQKLIGGILSTITSFVAILIFTAFVLIDLPKLKKFILDVIPKKYHESLIDLATYINRDLSGSIRGQLLICLLNGFLTTIALLILKVNFAITLGIIAAVFSLIPVFGTIFSTIPAMIIAATQSLFTSIQVLIVILIIHFIEANFFNPKIMGTSVELHPAIIIFSIFVGEHLFGIAGLLLAVPVIAIIRSLIIYTYKKLFLEE
ncbi:MAG: AI-2E family transporter [Candidatus Sericytochromatia bacterium]|nr:MAG: AI-2E family transporter [Candidatus Sericytochromatia bacterium]